MTGSSRPPPRRGTGDARVRGDQGGRDLRQAGQTERPGESARRNSSTWKPLGDRASAAVRAVVDDHDMVALPLCTLRDSDVASAILLASEVSGKNSGFAAVSVLKGEAGAGPASGGARLCSCSEASAPADVLHVQGSPGLQEPAVEDRVAQGGVMGRSSFVEPGKLPRLDLLPRALEWTKLDTVFGLADDEEGAALSCGWPRSPRGLALEGLGGAAMVAVRSGFFDLLGRDPTSGEPHRISSCCSRVTSGAARIVMMGARDRCSASSAATVDQDGFCCHSKWTAQCSSRRGRRSWHVHCPRLVEEGGAELGALQLDDAGGPDLQGDLDDLEGVWRRGLWDGKSLRSAFVCPEQRTSRAGRSVT